MIRLKLAFSFISLRSLVSNSMVSPLKTWQHDEPQYLWPVLGGLAALVHIGILGLSLPYVLEMMQSSGGGTSFSDTPIELVFVEPVESLSGRPLAQSEPPSTTESKVQTQNATAASSADVENVLSPAIGSIQSGVPIADPPDTRAVSNDPSPVQSAPSQEPAAASATSNTDEDGSATNNVGSVDDDQIGSALDDGTAVGDGAAENEVIGDDGTEDNSAGDDNEGGGEDIDGEGSDGGPTILPGDGGLVSPVPGSSNQTVQATYVRLGSPRELPMEFQKDRVDVPPRPTPDTFVNAIDLSLDSLGCGPVEMSRSGETYKLWIDEMGSVLEATLWTGGQSTGPEDEGDAIACLIENEGFVFEPAILQGEPAKSDHILVTVQVDAATGRTVPGQTVPGQTVSP